MRRATRALHTLIACGVFCWVHDAAAGQDALGEPPSDKRAVPDYDGRGPPDDGANAGIWLARVALSPLYVVSEYLIRQPLNALMKPLEAHDDISKLYDFFAFGPDHKIGFAPIAFVEFGFNPSVGIYGFWDDALVRKNSVRTHIDVWPTDWYAGSLADHFEWGNNQIFEIRASGINRPDKVFFGIGPDSEEAARSRFREARFDVSGMLDAHVWRSSRVRLWGGLRKVDLSDGHYWGDPSLSQESAKGAFAIPFGFNRGYEAPYGAINAVFDTRNPSDPRSGARLEAQGDIATDVKYGSSSWVHWGGVASAFLQVDRIRRILSVSAYLSFADPLGNDPIPFTELVSLGGEKWMAGYYPDRLIGRSAAVASVRYSWPIASWIDGTIEADVGNVFDAHLEGFKPGELRFSGAVGISTSTAVVASFAGAGSVGPTKQQSQSIAPRVEILAGFGTDTFDRGGTVQSVHVALGVPHSF